MIDIFLKLVEDKDQEIRTCCCNSIDVLCEKLSKEENFDKILKSFKKTSEDTVGYVKGEFEIK